MQSLHLKSAGADDDAENDDAAQAAAAADDALLDDALRALDSRSSLNLQFIDMVSGAIHSYFEFGESRHWAPLEPYVRLEKWNFE